MWALHKGRSTTHARVKELNCIGLALLAMARGWLVFATLGLSRALLHPSASTAQLFIRISFPGPRALDVSCQPNSPEF